MSPKEIVVSGIRSTGKLHLGNYFGAIRNYVRMQQSHECFFFVADVHSLTTHPEATSMQENVFRILSECIAAGLDPDQATLFVQSDLPQTLELYAYLNMIAYKGELEKTASFKEKARNQPDNVNAGLLTYPVLMAADILIHRGALVPVGKDQEQHLEMTRNLAVRFNHKYGDFFPEPRAFNFGEPLVKIGSLDGSGKMSKSENALSTIFLSDPDDQILKKVKKAMTDEGPQKPGTPMPPYIQNLFQLLELFSEKTVVAAFREDYDQCRIRYGDLKQQLARDMTAFIGPIREKAAALQADRPFLNRIMKQGAEKAGSSAGATIREVRRRIGFNYGPGDQDGSVR